MNHDVITTLDILPDNASRIVRITEEHTAKIHRVMIWRNPKISHTKGRRKSVKMNRENGKLLQENMREEVTNVLKIFDHTRF